MHKIFDLPPLPTPEDMKKINDSFLRWEVKQYLSYKTKVKCPVILKENFIFSVTKIATEMYMKEILEKNIPINPSNLFKEIIASITERHIFYCFKKTDVERVNLQESNDYKNKLASETINDLIINKYLGKVSLNTTIALYPPISKLIVINNLLYELFVKTKNINVENPKHMAINHVLMRIIEQVKSCCVLLDKSLIADAIALWRGLYESELTLVVLSYWPEDISKEYLEFSEFQLLELNINHPDKTTEELEAKLKEKASIRNVKKTISFIHYGWLMQTQEYYDKKCKLNLKEGLAVIADQYAKYSSYQLASNIAHSPFFSRILNEVMMRTYVIEVIAHSLDTIILAVLSYLKEENQKLDEQIVNMLENSKNDIQDMIVIMNENNK